MCQTLSRSCFALRSKISTSRRVVGAFFYFAHSRNIWLFQYSIDNNLGEHASTIVFTDRGAACAGIADNRFCPNSCCRCILWHTQFYSISARLHSRIAARASRAGDSALAVQTLEASVRSGGPLGGGRGGVLPSKSPSDRWTIKIPLNGLGNHTYARAWQVEESAVAVLALEASVRAGGEERAALEESLRGLEEEIGSLRAQVRGVRERKRDRLLFTQCAGSGKYGSRVQAGGGCALRGGVERACGTG